VDAPVALLASGLAADSAMWAPQMAMLASSFRVVRYDMRGHGHTAATAGDYSLQLLAEDVLALIRVLSLPRVHFIGASLGGMIGQFIGIHHAPALQSLTLCGTSSESSKESWSKRVAHAREHGIQPIVDATIERWFMPAYKAEQPAVIEEMRAMVLRTSKDGYAGCAAAIRDMAIAADIHRIPVPTLVIAGEDDLSTPVGAMEKIAHEIPGSWLARIPNAAHMPTMEQPALCNEAMRTFLAKLVAEPQPENHGDLSWAAVAKRS
jgi:3-oxoadipate enol-lactonase